MREVRRLPQQQVEKLAGEPFTYDPVGLTRAGGSPPGFHALSTTIPLGRGDEAFRYAADKLMTWRMHADAGLRVSASAERAHEGAVVLCRLGPLRIPCRVVWVRDEPDAVGFCYGTLQGHPEEGEEAFLVTRAGAEVTLAVSAYSRPGLLVTRLAGPVGRVGQRVMIRRYGRALRRD
jgi:uncharacterized protein (UPF0548 family)